MTTRRTPKKSLGNLLREEVQKDTEKDTDAKPLEGTREPDPSLSQPQRSSRSNDRSNTRNTPQRSKAAPEPSASPDPETPSNVLSDLQDLRLHLDQAQQQTSALAAEKAALEERLSHLTQILQQEVQLKQQAEQQVSQLQAQLSQAQLSQTQTSQTSALTLLPRSADFQTLALPRAFSRPIVDRPTPWEIPRRSLVITHTKPPSPSDLSDEDIGWFD